MLTSMMRTIFKHNKKIIAFWILLFIILLPMAGKLDEALQYSEEPFIPKNIESNIGRDILEMYFRDTGDLNTIIIAVKYNSSLYEEQDVLTRIIESNIERKNLTWIVQVISPTDTYEAIKEKYWEIMNKTYDEIYLTIYGNVTDIHHLLYEVKDMIIEVHDKTYKVYDSYHEMGEVLYGIPFYYRDLWIQIYREMYLSTYPEPVLDIFQINRLSQEITMFILSMRYDTRELENIYLYLNIIFSGWNSSFNNPYPDPSYIDNSTLTNITIASIQDAIDTLLAYPAVPYYMRREIREFTSNVYPIDWLNQSLLHMKLLDLSIEKVYQGISKYLEEEELNITITKSMLKDIYNLGRTIDDDLLKEFMISIFLNMSPPDYADMIGEIYELGPEPSELSMNRIIKKAADTIFNKILQESPPPRYPDVIIKEDIGLLAIDNRSALILIEYKDVEIEVLSWWVNILNNILEMEFKKGRIEEGYVTGEDILWIEMEEANKQDIENIDRMTVIFVILLLSVLLSSFIAPILPLITIGSAIFMAQGLLYLLSSILGLDIYYLSRSFLVTIMMGAGVDYAVYIIFRYFEERGEGSDVNLSVYRAGKFGGEAVISSGATVIAGFGGLAISRVGILSSIGLSLMLGILVALLTAVIVIPSLILLLGDKIMWPRRRPPKSVARGRLLKKAASYSVEKPWIIIGVFIIMTLILLVPTMQMSRSYDIFGMMPNLKSKQGYDFIIDNFGSKYLSKIDVIIELPSPLVIDGSLDKELYNSLEYLISSVKDIQYIDPENLYGPTRPYSQYLGPSNITSQDMESISEYISEDGRYVRFQLGLLVMYTSREAFDVISDTRSILSENKDIYLPGSKIYVTGNTALLYDVLNMIDQDFYTRVIPIVIILIYMILFLLLRSVFIPIRLILTILMSILWAVGFLILLFQFYIGMGIYWIIPILLFSLLMGLGMDYDIFLVSRIKEEVGRGRSDEDAIVRSVEKTGLVITACGLILAAALGTLMLSSSYILIESGFTLSLAILLDTFLVRIFLVPSIMMVLKKWNWWPSKPKVVEEL